MASDLGADPLDRLRREMRLGQRQPQQFGRFADIALQHAHAAAELVLAGAETELGVARFSRRVMELGRIVGAGALVE